MEKKIIVKITPAAVLLVVLLLVGAFLLHRGVRQEKRPLSIDDTPVIVTKIRSLGELTTACYYDEMVLSRTKENAFSSSALGSLAEGLGKDVEDHLVLIAKGKSLRFRGVRRNRQMDARGDYRPAGNGPDAAPDGRGPLWAQIKGLCRGDRCRDRTARRVRLHVHPVRSPGLLHPDAYASGVTFSSSVVVPVSGSGRLMGPDGVCVTKTCL